MFKVLACPGLATGHRTSLRPHPDPGPLPRPVAINMGHLFVFSILRGEDLAQHFGGSAGSRFARCSPGPPCPARSLGAGGGSPAPSDEHSPASAPPLPGVCLGSGRVGLLIAAVMTKLQ